MSSIISRKSEHSWSIPLLRFYVVADMVADILSTVSTYGQEKEMFLRIEMLLLLIEQMLPLSSCG